MRHLLQQTHYCYCHQPIHYHQPINKTHQIINHSERLWLLCFTCKWKIFTNFFLVFWQKQKKKRHTFIKSNAPRVCWKTFFSYDYLSMKKKCNEMKRNEINTQLTAKNVITYRFNVQWFTFFFFFCICLNDIQTENHSHCSSIVFVWTEIMEVMLINGF